MENILTNCIYFSELFAKFLANDANTLKIYSLQDSLVFSVTVYLVNHMLFYMISLLKFMLCIIYVQCEKNSAHNKLIVHNKYIYFDYVQFVCTVYCNKKILQIIGLYFSFLPYCLVCMACDKRAIIIM